MAQGTQSPPQNIDAEASLLGAILIDADAIVKIADTIHTEDTSPQGQWQPQMSDNICQFNKYITNR